MPTRSGAAPKRLVLGRETLRDLGGAPGGAGRETCMGGCSCLCGPDTIETADAR